MAKTYIKELQEKIEALEDGVDMKEVEINLLLSEMKDTTRPNILLLQLVQYVIQMLIELNEYQQKNKLTERMLSSKDRLVKMLDITSELNGMGDKMHSLKLANKFMIGKMSLLRIENSDLRKELKGVEDAHNYKTT